LPMTCHCCNLKVWVSSGAKPRRWASLTRDTQKGILSEYNEDLIFLFPHQLNFWKKLRNLRLYFTDFIFCLRNLRLRFTD